MRTISAGRFEAQCLELHDEVAEAGETIVVTKRRKPAAKIEAIEKLLSLEGNVVYLVSGEELVAPIDEVWRAEVE